MAMFLGSGLIVSTINNGLFKSNIKVIDILTSSKYFFLIFIAGIISFSDQSLSDAIIKILKYVFNDPTDSVIFTIAKLFKSFRIISQKTSATSVMQYIKSLFSTPVSLLMRYVFSEKNLRKIGFGIDLLSFALSELGIYGCLNILLKMVSRVIGVNILQTLVDKLNYKNIVPINANNFDTVYLKLFIFAFNCLYQFLETDYDIKGIFKEFSVQILAPIILTNAGKITDLEFLRPTLRIVFQPYVKGLSGPRDERMVNFVNELQSNNLIDQEQIKKLNAIMYIKTIDDLNANDLVFLANNINKIKELESVKNTPKLSEHIEKISEAHKKHVNVKNTKKLLNTNLSDTILDNECTFYLRPGWDITYEEEQRIINEINSLSRQVIKTHLLKQDEYESESSNPEYIRINDPNDDTFPFKVGIYIEKHFRRII